MHRAFACLLALAMLAGTAAAAPAGPDAAALSAANWRAVCHHYVNRARFKPRSGDVEAITVIADACPPALAAAQDPNGQAAAQFLSRLAGAQAVIAAMNADRFAAANPERIAAMGQFRDFARSRRQITSTGEYLILRAEGVFEALGAWADGESGFALRAALP